LDQSIEQAVKSFGSNYRLQKDYKQKMEKLKTLNEKVCRQINQLSWDDPKKDEMVIQKGYLEKDIKKTESEMISSEETAILKNNYKNGLNVLQDITQHIYNEGKRWHKHFDNFISGLNEIIVVSDNVYKVANFVAGMCEFMIPATNHVSAHIGATDKIYKNCFVDGGLKPNLQVPVDKNQLLRHSEQGNQKIEERAYELQDQLEEIVSQKYLPD